MWGSVADNETGVSNKLRSEKQNHPATPIKNQTPNQRYTDTDGDNDCSLKRGKDV